MNIENYEGAITSNAKLLLRDGDDYPSLLAGIKATFKRRITMTQADGKTIYRNLYRSTYSKGMLYDTFLANLPEEARQHYNCNSCRSFVNRYGAILTVDDDGQLVPVMWDLDAVPPFFQKAVAAVYDEIPKRISVPFFSVTPCLGWPVTGPWTHMSVGLPSQFVTTDPNYVTNRYHEMFLSLWSVVKEYDLGTVATAINLYKADKLCEKDRYLPVANTLHVLISGLTDRWPGYKRIENAKNLPTDVHTYLWQFVMYHEHIHIKNTVLDTLLEDIKNKVDLDAAIDRYNRKADPMHYQRTSKVLTNGAIDQAEKLINEMGLVPSLARRYARLEEVQCIWKPREATTPTIKSDSVFGYLKAEAQSEDHRDDPVIDAGKITLEKFIEKVLPGATEIVMVINQYNPLLFGSFVTAVNPDAPPIITWDKENARNPVSWFMVGDGDKARGWNLGGTNRIKVTGIAYTANMWQPGYDYIPTSCFFLLDNCRPANPASIERTGPGLCLFPEILRPELRDVRAVVERYSSTHTLEGADMATACGIAISKGINSYNTTNVRVTDNFGTRRYIIDRWD